MNKTPSLEFLDLDSLSKDKSLDEQRKWLDTIGLEELKKVFLKEKTSPNVKAHIFSAINRYIFQEEVNPARLIRSVKDMTEDRARIYWSLLEKGNLLKGVQKKIEKSAFY